MLVEIAWHYRHQPAEGAKLRARRQGQPSWVIAVADRAQRRLHGKYWRMLARNKAPNIATVAVARELGRFPVVGAPPGSSERERQGIGNQEFAVIKVPETCGEQGYEQENARPGYATGSLGLLDPRS